MAYTSQNEVNTAMYSVLMPSGTLDATLAHLGLLAVYDFTAVPQNAPFDYLTIGDGNELHDDTLGVLGHSDGYKYNAKIHIWSSQRGTQNPVKMVDRLDQLFHRQSLTLATLTHVWTMRTNLVFMADPQSAIPYVHIIATYQTYSVQP